MAVGLVAVPLGDLKLRAEVGAVRSDQLGTRARARGERTLLRSWNSS